MLSASIFFTLLVFIIINFLILFLVKTRLTIVVSLIIAHLSCVLFFSISIASFEFFREIVLALIVYSMVILFLISNEDLSHKEEAPYKKDSYTKTALKIATIGVFFVAVFVMIFSLTKNIEDISKANLQKKEQFRSEVAINPLASKSYQAHAVVKKFYLEDMQPNALDKIDSSFEKNDKKLARLRDKLTDNFLLKRSSDMIVIIVAISSILLLLSNKRNKYDQSL